MITLFFSFLIFLILGVLEGIGLIALGIFFIILAIIACHTGKHNDRK